MKKLAVLLLLLAPVLSEACDICGCGAGNAYVGILPEFQKRIFGLRYRYNDMRSHLGSDGSTTYLTTQERYHTLEAWSAWNITEKVRIIATIPYAFDSRENQGTVQSKNGISDIAVYGFYQLLNDKRTALRRGLLVQALWVGGGIKLPTGKYNPSDDITAGQRPNLFQLGTGSYDISLHLMYDLRYQDAGMNINAAYRFNTLNRYGYQYGNKWNLTTQLYYKLRINNLALTPNMGIQFENLGIDLDDNLEVTATGGQVLMGTAGVETSYKKFICGANFQAPVSQQLGNGSVRAGNRIMLHFGFTL